MRAKLQQERRPMETQERCVEGRYFSYTEDYRYTVQDGEAGRSSIISGN